jgi:RNA polymerase sigma factor (sigma-70 family)
MRGSGPLPERSGTFSPMLTSKGTERVEMKHLTDEELMAIVQSGDHSPASEIYDRYSRRIYNFAYRFLRNSELAEDAMQEVFFKMLKNANQFHGDAKLSTWLFSITANWCRDYMRKIEHRRKEPESVLATIPASSEGAPDRILEKRRIEARIQSAMEVLNDDQREAILLSRYQGMSYREIAKIAGCSEGAVKTRVFRGMELLKLVLMSEPGEGDQCQTVSQ